MSKRIVFISIFDLTRLFFEISKGLIEHGHEVFWITTNEIWTRWLIDQGVAPEDIKQLVYDKSDFINDSDRRQLIEQIVKSESNASLTINQSMLMDQFIEQKQKPDISEYMLLYYRDIKQFLNDKSATHIIAEPTNSNEMIAYMVCRELGIKFISPRHIRYPSDRLLLFDSYHQEKPLIRNNNGDGIDGRKLIEDFATRKPAPYYFAKHNKTKTLDPRKIVWSIGNRIKRYQTDSGRGLTHHNLSGRIKLSMRRTINGQYMRWIWHYDDLSKIESKIAFYGLHVQPESSIDVLGSYFSDQLKLIKDIRRALPFDVTLVVKEHPNFLGIKSIDFFRKLKRIPNVVLVRHDISTFEIYKRASIIFTVSGTTGYEGGMLGIPVVMFCPIYFDGLSSVHTCTDLTLLQELVDKLLNSFERDYEADCEYMKEMVGNSYPGFWTDPNLYPEVLDPDNIRKLREAFLEVVNRNAD
ncbi:MAG: hypothetical protein V3V99_14225 [candidate division Zixibacteria bacterium]